MQEVRRRQMLFPYVFEEQIHVLRDRAGRRDVRKARCFSRVEENGEGKVLLVFDTPAEVRGVALLIKADPAGHREYAICLPALGKKMIGYRADSGQDRFLGTDLAVEDFLPDVTARCRYVRAEDQKVDSALCYVIDAFPINKDPGRAGSLLRRHFIRQDNFCIIRTDFHDRRNRLLKRRTLYDLAQVGGGLWRANMMLMKSPMEGHETLVKVDRRIFSRDYAPAEMFTASWLLENRHMTTPGKRLFQDDSHPEKGMETGR